MENMGVLIVYIAVFLLLCVLLMRAVRRNRHKDWGVLLGLEVLAAIGSFCAIHIFDALPGKGMMPGLAWFGAVLYSMGAVAVYAILLLITVVIWALKQK